MSFDERWRRLTAALSEPRLYTVEDGEERFHAWHDPGGDGKPEAIWTKPLQGAKQVRLPLRKENFALIDAAVRAGTRPDADACRDLTLRGHYIYTILQDAE